MRRALAMGAGVLVVISVLAGTVHAQLLSIPCQTAGNTGDVSACMFDGPTCNWVTNFVNFDNEAVWYDVYKNHPVPSATSQFVIEGGNPTLVPGGLKMPMTYPKDLAQPTTGTIVSTTRFLLYGVVSATFKSSGVPGLVSSFITFGNNEDEIDVEIGGGDSTNVQFNWYWHGIKELNAKGASLHGHIVNTPLDNSENYYTYTIDWNAERIIWSINGVVQYTATADSPRFPSSPSRIAFGVWQAQWGSTWAGTNDYTKWRKDTPPFVQFQTISVACAAQNGPPAVPSSRPAPTPMPTKPWSLPPQPPGGPSCSDITSCLFNTSSDSKSIAPAAIVTVLLIAINVFFYLHH
ncbi:unnamed protein product (mitochondrion) [Plasmodiophora brassicae]|uniref:GH16 domain-containing protein n=1 Tax=Plasmodiophora brassicae TaxID=37360 RepID=A0A3P3Y0E3_PLABS|nr:unnamed protein product [Plasmodiophora brassicae]